MTRPEITTKDLRQTAAWEWIVRFVFGGAITVVTGVIGAKYGPTYGGMFMAFPAIMPASLTLVRRHDGCAQAEQDARGGRLGTIGLAAFALVVAVTAGAWPAPLVLVAATLAWAVVAVAAWLIAGRA